MSFNESSYFNTVVRNGSPILYWKLEDGATSVSGGSLAGTYPSAEYVGTASFKPGWVDKTDECLDMFGGNVYVNIGDCVTSTTIADGKMSISMWVEPMYDDEDKPESKQETIFCQDSSGVSQRLLTLTLGRSNTLALGTYVTGGSVFPLLESSKHLRKDTWYYVVVVIDNSKYSIYIDGMLDTQTVTTAYTVTDDVTTYFGAWVTNTSYPLAASSSDYTYYSGQLDELGLFDTAITPTQLKVHVKESSIENIDSIVSNGSVIIEDRVEVYTINWPNKFGSITYSDSVISSNPHLYHKMDGDKNIQCLNYGILGDLNLGTYTVAYPDANFDDTTVDLCDTCAYFSGASSYVDVGHLTYASGTKFTQEVWLYVDTLASYVVAALGNSTNNRAYIATSLTSGKMYAVGYIDHGGSSTTVASTSELVAGKWNQIVLRVDGSAVKLFINGVEDASTATSNTLDYNATDSVRYGASRTAIAGKASLTGWLDEASVYLHALSDSLIYEHFRLGYYGLTLNPDRDIDVAPAEDLFTTTTYTESVLNSGAAQYWPLTDSARTPGQPYINLASGGVSNAVSDLVHTNDHINVGSPVHGETQSRTFRSTYYAISQDDTDLHQTSPSTAPIISVEFWLKRGEGNTTYGRHTILGYSLGEFSVWLSQNRMGVSALRWDGSYYHSQETSALLTDAQDGGSASTEWHHYVVTVTAAGRVKIWQDGVLKYTDNMSGGYGIKGITNSSSRLLVAKSVSSHGLADPGDVSVNAIHMAALALYNKELTSDEIHTRYMIGTYGPGYAKKTFDQDNTQSGVTSASCNQLAHLSDRRDISRYVQSFALDFQLDRPIDSGLLVLRENIDSTYIESNLNVNDYVIISQKYSTPDGLLDSGWLQVGHYLCDGSPGTEISHDNSSKVIKLSSLFKLVSLDLYAGKLSPDKLLVEKSNLEFYEETSETYVFRKKRDTVPIAAATDDDKYYYNWAESPSVKLYVTQFQNLYAGANTSLAQQDVLVSDEFQIRGSEGSIQILGGTGAVVFNKNKYNASVPEDGYGGPDKGTLGSDAPGVSAEFWRYATLLDTYGGLVNGDVQIADMDIVDYKVCVSFSQTIPDLEGKTLFVKSGKAKGKMFKCRKTTTVTTPERVYLTDVHGRTVNPYLQGLKIDDYVQVGDSNTLEDAYRKFLLHNYFQENDPSKPFYFEIDQSLLEVLVKPFEIKLLDNVSGIDMIKELENYSPQNYVIYVDRKGVVRTKNIIVDNLTIPDHEITYAAQEANESTDFGVYTKIVAQGQSTQSVNVALHSGYGGNAAVRAYKLSNFANPSISDHLSVTPNGYTLSQSDANDTWAQVLDDNGNTPYLATSSGFTFPGWIYRKYGTTVRKFDMSSTDLCVIDLGLNTRSTGILEYEIDMLQLTYMNPYRTGQVINPSIEIWYMTESDYTAEYGVSAPKVPSQTDADGVTSYLPDSDARSWKLLVEDFNLKEGQMSIESSEFEEKRPIKLRYLKIRAGQPAFRYSIPGQGDDGVNRYSSICLADFKAWTSNRIIASAELGVTPPFDTGNEKELAKRYTTRTALLDLNPYIDTYKDLSAFAVSELRERKQEFKPKVVKLINPLIRPGEYVSYLPVSNYYNGFGVKNYVVYSYTYNSEDNHTANVMLMNYDI